MRKTLLAALSHPFFAFSCEREEPQHFCLEKFAAITDVDPTTNWGTRMAKKPNADAHRERKVRGDANVSAAERVLAKVAGLPVGAVKIVKPGGKKARADAHIESVRKMHKKRK